MSSTHSTPAGQQRSQTDLSSAKPSRRAIDVVEEFFEHDELCRWCLAEIRSFYPEYDEALANRLYQGTRKGSNKLAFSSSGYSLNTDGSLQVNSATSDADPATYQEVIAGPPKDGFECPDGYLHTPSPTHPPRSKTICHECAEIDIDPTADRPRAMLITALENMLERMQSDWRDYGIAVNAEAAVRMAHELRDYRSMSGKDKLVLAKALDYSSKYA